jgi:phospholipid/cholesterol/gamma-HCH transport system permease protein
MAGAGEYIEGHPGSDSIFLKGEWVVSNAAAIEKALRRYKRSSKSSAIDGRDLKDLDTAGAWLIHKNFPEVEIENLSPRHQELMNFVPTERQKKSSKKPPSLLTQFFINIGEATCWAYDFTYALFSFMGMIYLRLLRNIFQPLHFRFPSIARHMYETGVQAFPIISLLAFGISMVISYQGAMQLQKFGADIYTIDLTVISLLREMAVLTTAIMVAGRSGSAFAAEIGVMKMRGEVDALQTMGMNPLETLVLPRLLALLLTLPMLSFIADMVGLAGGAFMSVAKLDISLSQYINRVQSIATPTMFFIGMIKAPVFALLITAVCTYQGMSATGSAENVGKLTTLAVVQSIFLVIMVDAIFSVVFSKAGI